MKVGAGHVRPRDNLLRSAQRSRKERAMGEGNSLQERSGTEQC